MDLQREFLLQFLVLILIFLSNGRVESISQNNVEYRRQVGSLNKISIKTIKDKHGEIFHCIIMSEQPAFDHPRLKNHTIQMSSMIPKIMPDEATKRKRLFNIGLNTSCPNGTVLVRQYQQGYFQTHSTFDSVWNSQYRPPPEEHFAGVTFKTGMTWKYYGAQTTMDVFNISNILTTQASAVRVSLIKGLYGPIEYFNCISAGWGVEGRLYGDKISRLIIFWTADGNKKTGCVNLYCPGFIQLSKTVTPGMRLPIGKGVLKLTIYKDAKTLNWYLLMGEQEIIGYWPKELFNNLVDASEIHVDGYVYSPLNEPSPPMGNGLFPKPDPSKACEVSHIRLVNEKGDFLVPGSDIISYFHEPGYYDVVNVPGVNDFSISVGGPGGYKH